MININFIFDKFHNNRPISNIVPMNDTDEIIDGVISSSFFYDIKMYGFDLLYKFNNDIESPYQVNYISTNQYKNGVDGINFYPIVMNLKDLELSPWPLLYLDFYIVQQVNLNKIKLILMAPFAKADMENPVDYVIKTNQIVKMAHIDNPSNVILMASDNWVKKQIDDYGNSLNGLCTRYVNINFYEKISRYLTKKDYSEINFFERYFAKIHKDKTFLFLNNYPKRHRFLTCKFLEYKGKLGEGYVSWRNPITLNDYLNNPENLYDFKKTINDQIFSIKLYDPTFYEYIFENPSMELRVLDNDEGFNPRDPNLTGCLMNTEWIENSYFSVIGEHIVSHNVHISEKIYKLFYYSHPFIVHSTPGTLKYLREIGYRTFPELFDESYDDMEESPQKLLFICNQILKYCSDEGRRTLQEKLPLIKETLEHNRNLFLHRDFNEFWTKI